MADALWVVAMAHSMNRERKKNRMNDLISKLSEIRSEYNCFNQDEEPYYRALSEVISILSRRTDDDIISRQAAIDVFRKELCREREYATPESFFISFKGCERILNELPSAERREVQSSECEYWDNERNFCALYRPSAERHGRWIRTGEDGYCSICNCDMPMYKEDWEWRYLETPYCPNCGAIMCDTITRKESD